MKATSAHPSGELLQADGGNTARAGHPRQAGASFGASESTLSAKPRRIAGKGEAGPASLLRSGSKTAREGPPVHVVRNDGNPMLTDRRAPATSGNADVVIHTDQIHIEYPQGSQVTAGTNRARHKFPTICNRIASIINLGFWIFEIYSLIQIFEISELL